MEQTYVMLNLFLNNSFDNNNPFSSLKKSFATLTPFSYHVFFTNTNLRAILYREGSNFVCTL